MYCNGNRNSRVFGSFSKPTWWSCRRCLRMKAARRCASLGLWISFGAMSYQDLRFPSSVVGFWQSLASGGTRVVVARQNWAGLVPDFPQFQNWWIDRVWKGLIGRSSHHPQLLWISQCSQWLLDTAQAMIHPCGPGAAKTLISPYEPGSVVARLSMQKVPE